MRRAGHVWLSIAVAGLWALTGCAPVVLQPASAVPSAPQWYDTEFVVRDGSALPYTSWLPPEDAPPHAVIVAVHGFNDYRRAFELPGSYLAAQGAAVFAYDQRGFGAAPGRGLWPGKDLLVTDLVDVVSLVAARYPRVPVFMLGDSMGAGVVMLAAQRPELAGRVRGIVLNAPAVWGEQTFNPFYRAGLWVLAHTVPSWEVTSRGLKIRVSDNIDLLRSLSRDPLMLRGARTDVLYGLVRLMDDAIGTAAAVPVPTLILYGLRDEVIPKDAVCRLLERAPAGTLHRFYPSGYHLLLRDLGAAEVWADLRQWLEGNVTQSTDAEAPCRSSTALGRHG